MTFSLKEILEHVIFSAGEYDFTVFRLVMVVGMIVGVRIILWAIKKTIQQKWKYNNLDSGGQYAVYQIIRYAIYVFAIVLILELLGFKVTLLVAGSAALLVGIGLGLQQTFNDIVSGVILLIEGSTKIGDILQLDDHIVKVEKIGLRASKVINRDDVMIIIPNSLIVTNKVINWSHQIQETRFHVTVGVSYGSDVDLVMRLLEQSATEHPLCSKKRKPEARFVAFGESSLNFEVLFWSHEMFRIDRTKSDIRRNIIKKLRENGIVIPFPQRDLHIKSNDAKPPTG